MNRGVFSMVMAFNVEQPAMVAVSAAM